MAQAKLATYRVEVQQTISGQTHTNRMYVKSDGTVIGGKIQLQDRAAANQDWDTVARQFSKTVSRLTNNTASLSNVVLKQKVGLLWVPLDFATPVNDFQADATQVATEVTLVLRDTAFNKVKVVCLDTILAPPVHYASPPGAGNAQTFSKNFLDIAASVNNPWAFMVSLSNHYLHLSAFVGMTITLNRRVRRRRGLT